MLMMTDPVQLKSDIAQGRYTAVQSGKVSSEAEVFELERASIEPLGANERMTYKIVGHEEILEDVSDLKVYITIDVVPTFV
jgi:hypothetical protein